MPALYFKLCAAPEEVTRRTTSSMDLLVSARFKVCAFGSGLVEETPGFMLILSDSTKLWCFAVLIAQVDALLSENPHSFQSPEDIDSFLDIWIEFFTTPSISEQRAVGLWGELHILSKFRSAGRGVACWVGPTGQPYDFFGESIRLEIKTSVRSPEAWFSATQVREKADYQIGFIRLVPDPVEGFSLDDLVRNITERMLGHEAEFLRLLTISGYRPGLHRHMKFTVEDTFSLRAGEIPLPVSTDWRIKDVRFSIDVDQFRNSGTSLDALLVAMGSRRSSGLPLASRARRRTARS